MSSASLWGNAQPTETSPNQLRALSFGRPPAHAVAAVSRQVTERTMPRQAAGRPTIRMIVLHWGCPLPHRKTANGAGAAKEPFDKRYPMPLLRDGGGQGDVRESLLGLQFSSCPNTGERGVSGMTRRGR